MMSILQYLAVAIRMVVVVELTHMVHVMVNNEVLHKITLFEVNENICSKLLD